MPADPSPPPAPGGQDGAAIETTPGLRHILWFILWLVPLFIVCLLPFFAWLEPLMVRGEIMGEPGVVGRAYIVALAAFYVAALLALAGAFALQGRRAAGMLGLRPTTRSWLVFGAVATVATSFALDLVGTPVREWVSGSDAPMEIQEIVTEMTETQGLLMASLAVAGLLGPLIEELVFRGLLFGALRRYVTFWPAALVSAVLFGAAHVEPAHAIQAGLLGLVLAWLYERSFSLWVPIAAHMVNNLAAVIAVSLGY